MAYCNLEAIFTISLFRICTYNEGGYIKNQFYEMGGSLVKAQSGSKWWDSHHGHGDVKALSTPPLDPGPCSPLLSSSSPWRTELIQKRSWLCWPSATRTCHLYGDRARVGHQTKLSSESNLLSGLLECGQGPQFCLEGHLEHRAENQHL